MTRTWRDVWAARTLDTSRSSMLEQLMAADGLDTGFGNVTEAAWREFALRTAARLGITGGTNVFEVGCGAGAFLLPIREMGARVGGIDQSPALIRFALEAMPDGRWSQGDAAGVDTNDRWDVVLACGVFLYFPSLDYAAAVLRRMMAKSIREIAVLDIPDAARRDEAMAFRRGTLGAAEYEAKYRGLDHLFYERTWMRDTLVALGATSVVIEDQRVDGYRNAAFRFNVFASR